MRIKIAGTVNDSIVDGPGLRYAVFVQGCSHHCPGCQNPHTWSFDGGIETHTELLIEEMKKNPLLSGLTLSGGEPFEQPEACLDLAQEAHKMGLNVWCYTGYTWEELMLKEYDSVEAARKDKMPAKAALMMCIDVLVDGPFIKEEKTLELSWRGSKNQRLIDVQESIKQNKVVLWEEKESW